MGKIRINVKLLISALAVLLILAYCGFASAADAQKQPTSESIMISVLTAEAKYRAATGFFTSLGILIDAGLLDQDYAVPSKVGAKTIDALVTPDGRWFTAVVDAGDNKPVWVDGASEIKLASDSTDVDVIFAASLEAHQAELSQAIKPVQVMLETTKGEILLTVHPEWAPIGAAHFLEMVSVKYYDGAPWFRVIDKFVAQCGIAADPKMNEKWMEQTINDEPVVTGNKRGMVSFGKSSMPNSRSTHIFINYVDNSRGLDGQGFPAFAEVSAGMDVADKLARCEFDNQGALGSTGGLDMFKKKFPEADYIVRAYVVHPKPAK
jgi:peptidyl-prolyl cis-trans isomerase A (cyclophilin A)